MAEPWDRIDKDLLTRGHLRLDTRDRVLTITLDRPDARNAQTPATWEALARIGDIASQVDDLDAVVVTGSGPSFSAGLDRRMFTPEGIPGELSLMSLAALDDGGIDRAIERIQDGFTWLRQTPALTVALVQGHAIGAGFQLALACDLLIAAPDARFAMRETSYGLVPDLAGTWPLVRSVGYGRALEICASGREVGAEEGYLLGFVTRVDADPRKALDGLLAAIRAAPPGAVRDVTDLLRGADGRTPTEQQSAERQAQARRLRSLLALLGG